jgi:hypothetical protein
MKKYGAVEIWCTSHIHHRDHNTTHSQAHPLQCLALSTPLYQPVDVGFNKPFKDRMRRQLMTWMMSEGIIHGTTSQPVRRDVATWVNNAMEEMRREIKIMQNPWKKTSYEWFVKGSGGD